MSNCPDPQASIPCPPEVTVDCCHNNLMVCCVEYDDVEEAWKKTGIPPHKLKFMASSPAFDVYWT